MSSKQTFNQSSNILINWWYYHNLIRYQNGKIKNKPRKYIKKHTNEMTKTKYYQTKRSKLLLQLLILLRFFDTTKSLGDVRGFEVTSGYSWFFNIDIYIYRYIYVCVCERWKKIKFFLFFHFLTFIY